MYAASRILATALAVLLLVSLGGCRGRTPKENSPAMMSQDFKTGKVGIAWFTQPTTTSALITGQLPARQGKINPGMLSDLDGALARIFAAESACRHISLPMPSSMPGISLHESGSPQGLRTWLEVGRKAQVDLLVVPYIIHWQERDGGAAGVARGAAVKAEFHLLDVAGGRLIKHFIFEEEQVGLANNLLTAGKFFKRKARWISAMELTQEGMRAAVKDFGL